jgi:hypothetical protein
MDVFRLRDTIIERYSDFVTSFVRIKDPALKVFVAQHIDSELLGRQPLIQVNPAIQASERIDQVIQSIRIRNIVTETSRKPTLNGS